MSSLMACIAGMALDAVFGDPYGFIIRCGSLQSGFRCWKNGCANFAKMKKKRENRRGDSVVWCGYGIRRNSVGTFVSCRKGQLLASICTGNLLVLSASCRKVPER